MLNLSFAHNHCGKWQGKLHELCKCWVVVGHGRNQPPNKCITMQSAYKLQGAGEGKGGLVSSSPRYYHIRLHIGGNVCVSFTAWNARTAVVDFSPSFKSEAHFRNQRTAVIMGRIIVIGLFTFGRNKLCATTTSTTTTTTDPNEGGNDHHFPRGFCITLLILFLLSTAGVKRKPRDDVQSTTNRPFLCVSEARPCGRCDEQPALPIHFRLSDPKELFFTAANTRNNNHGYK